MPATVRLKQILFHARNQYFDLLRADLMVPGRIEWPRSPEEFFPNYGDTRSLLPDELHSLFDLSLLSHLFLAQSAQANRTSWIKKNLKFEILFPGLDANRLLNGEWRSVPAAVTSGNGSYCEIIFLMVGTLKDRVGDHNFWPSWLTEKLAGETMEVINNAFSAARGSSSGKGDLFFYPLISLENCPTFSGVSLGLPLALGGIAALEGSGFASHTLATGGMTPTGEVTGVNHEGLVAKAATCVENNYRLFLVPDANFPLADVPEGIEVHGVGSLKLARLWAQRFEPGNSAELKRIETAMNSPSDFVAILGNLSADSIDWYRNQRDFNEILQKILNDNDLFSSLASAFEKSVKKFTGDYGRPKAISRLIPRETIDFAGGQFPVAAFRWCSINLSLANHFGLTKESSEWAGLAKKFRPLAEKQSPKDVSRFVNRFYVDTLHNRFMFKPELPREFMEIIEEELKYWRKGTTNYVVGSLYGTMAQNYGFCGTRYLKEIEDCVKRSQEAFGNGTDESLKDDWRRQFSYLAFAFLDAGRFDEAKKALFNFLDLCG